MHASNLAACVEATIRHRCRVCRGNWNVAGLDREPLPLSTPTIDESSSAYSDHQQPVAPTAAARQQGKQYGCDEKNE